MEKSTRKIIALLSLVFLTWGVITSVNAILVPYFKELFLLNYRQSMLVQVAFYLAPLLACIPTSILMNIKGYKTTLLYSLLCTVLGMFLFFVMINMHAYIGVLLSIFIIAVGVAAMQVVANPYVIKLAFNIPSVKILTFTSSINSLGTVVAPLCIGALLALLGIANIYLIMALLITYLAYQIYKTKIENFKYKNAGAAISQLKAIGQHSDFISGAITIFVYVGTEVAIGTLTISYFHHPEIGNLTMAKATMMISLYWACAMVGRFLYSLIADKVNTAKSIISSTCIAMGLIIFAIYSQNIYGGIALICIGLCNSFLHPVIFACTIKRLGALTGFGSAILIMCNLGGGVIPLIQAAIIDLSSIATSYVVPLLSYMIIFSYAIRLSKQEKNLNLVPPV